jgi:hypothetical protein
MLPHSRYHRIKRANRPEKHARLHGLTFPAGRSLPLVATNLPGRQLMQPPLQPRQ